MRLTFIMPTVGKKEGDKYLKTWQMEPLPLAQLVSLTPKDVEIDFFDDRMEHINYDKPTDVVALTVETYTAKRAYEIARRYRKKGVLVVMGGFHPTLLPEEVSEHADIVVEGEAENIWNTVISDIKKGKYKKRYKATQRPSLNNLKPDRTIFKDRKYLPLSLVESARGCRFSCKFCSIHSFYKSTYNARPIKDVISEIKNINKKHIFLVDDNLFADPERIKQLFKELSKLKIGWFGQISINVAHDEKMLDLMKESGCIGVLIGFESLNKNNLAQMNKSWNQAVAEFDEPLKKIRERGFVIYATFIFGYDEDDKEAFDETLKFALKHRFFLIAFNHLVPFPNTPIYEQLKNEGRLLSEKWWLGDYGFGDVVFRPQKMTPEELSDACILFRKEFYSTKNIFRRALGLGRNFKNLRILISFFVINFLFKKEVAQRKGIPIGKKHE